MKWKCPLCINTKNSKTSPYPSRYVTGRFPSDRLELFYSSVDYKVSEAYQARAPQAPFVFFLVETTRLARSQGVVNAAAEAIYDLLKNFKFPGMDREAPSGQSTKFGLITFDSELTFYRRYDLDENKAAKGFESVTLPDIDDVFPKETVLFPPIRADECVFSVAKDGSKFADEIAYKLPSMFPIVNDESVSSYSSPKARESCLIAAIRTAYLIVKQNGGKLMTFAASPCTQGGLIPGPRHAKNDEKKPPRPEDLMTVNHKNGAMLKAFGEELAKAQVTCDLFLCPPANMYVDIASLSDFSHRSGGEVKYFPGFSYHSHSQLLRQSVERSMTRRVCWEAILKFRCSPQWKITHLEGNFTRRQDALIPMPSCNSDTSITVFLTPSADAISTSPCYLQLALLYSDSYFQRRSRVHTIQIPTRSLGTPVGVVSMRVPRVPIDIRGPSNAIAVCLLQCIRLACPLVDNPGGGVNYGSVIVDPAQAPTFQFPKTVQARVDMLVDAIIANTNPQSQEDLNEYISLCMAILKNPVLKPFPTNNTSYASYDTRSALISRLVSMDIHTILSNFLKPTLFQLYPFCDETCGNPNATLQASLSIESNDDPRVIQLPAKLRLSRTALRSDGIFSLVDGDHIVLVIGTSVNVDILRVLFAVDTLDAVQPSLIGATLEYYAAQAPEGSDGKRISRMLQAIKYYMSYGIRRFDIFPQVIGIRDVDPKCEEIFLDRLIEDPIYGLPDLNHFIARALDRNKFVLQQKMNPTASNMVPGIGTSLPGSMPNIPGHVMYKQ